MRKKPNKLRLSQLLMLAFMFAIFGSTMMPRTNAQSDDPGSLQLTTSPLPISLSARPGQKVTTELKIRNGGLKDERLKVGLMKFSAYGEEGKPLLEERAKNDDYFDWVSFSETNFLAESNKWHNITMTITLPDSAAFGYYYAVIFSRANVALPTPKTEAKLEGGTATLVLLEAIVPNANREIKLDSFSVEKRFYEFLPAKFVTKLSNAGNVHGIPHGTIFIRRGGKQVAAVAMNDTSGNILPGSKRNFDADWSDGFPFYKLKEDSGGAVLKDGKTSHQLEWDFSKITRLRFGKYTAHLVMVYDDGTKDVPAEAIVSFWVVPWRIIFFSLIIIVLSGFGLWSVLRRFVKRPRNKYELR